MKNIEPNSQSINSLDPDLPVARIGKNFLLLLIISGVFLVLIAGIGGFYLGKKSIRSTKMTYEKDDTNRKSETTFSPKPLATTEGLQTYRNDILGVKFSYSNTYKVEDVTDPRLLANDPISSEKIIGRFNISKKNRVPDVDYNSEFEAPDVSFTVFENSSNEDVQSWYKKNQYTPEYFSKPPGPQPNIPITIDGNKGYAEST